MSEAQDGEWQVHATAAALAIAHVNAAEILSGVSLQLERGNIHVLRALSGDEKLTNYRAAQADAIVTELVAAGVVATVGAGWSSDVLAVSPALHAAGIPLLSHTATLSALSNASKYPLFGRMCPPDSQQSMALADTVKHFGWQRIALIHCNDAYCRSLASATERWLGENGLSVDLVREMDNQPSSTDVEQVLDEVEGRFTSDCEGANVADQAVVLLTVHQLLGRELVMRAAAREMKTTWLAADGISANPGSEAENDGQKVLVLSHSFDPTLQPGRYQALQDAIPEPVTAGIAFAYDAVWSIAHAMAAIQAAGTAAVDNSTAIASALYDVEFHGVSGDVSFDDSLDRAGGYDLLFFDGRSERRSPVGSWVKRQRALLLFGGTNFSLTEAGQPCVAAALDNASALAPLLLSVLGLGLVAAIAAAAVTRIRTVRDRGYLTFISHEKKTAKVHAATLHKEFDRHFLTSCGSEQEPWSCFLEPVSPTLSSRLLFASFTCA